MKTSVIVGLTYFPLLYLQIFFLIFWYLIVFYSFGLIKLKKNRIICLIFLEILILVPIYLHYSYYFKKPALVKTENAILYAGPSEEYHQLKNVTGAQEVEIMQKIGDWFKIHYDDTNGWLKADDLTLL